MFQIYDATPDTNISRKDLLEFLGLVDKLQPGQAFDFPINTDLKKPLTSFAAAARKSVPKDVRFRWVLKGDGTATVYRIR